MLTEGMWMFYDVSIKFKKYIHCLAILFLFLLYKDTKIKTITYFNNISQIILTLLEFIHEDTHWYLFKNKMFLRIKLNVAYKLFRDS